MRRMKDMAAVSGPMGSFYANMPDEVTLTVNGNHPIYQQLLKEGNTEVKEKSVRNLADLALLSQGLLKGAELTSFYKSECGVDGEVVRSLEVGKTERPEVHHDT